MKTNYYFPKKMSFYSLFGLLALLTTSCGSYQNSSYYDNDGIYGDNEKSKSREVANSNSGYYKEYFSSLSKENEQVFTDVEKYSSQNDSIKRNVANEQQPTNNYPSWGSNPDNVTVNIYNSGWYTPSWGYYSNNWYGNYWGYNGWYGNYWGYNGWYSPSWSWSWGWNSWYGPSWYGYYGYNYYPYGYGYYGNNWGWNNGHLGHNYAYSGGRRNTNFISNGNGGGYISNRRTSGIIGRSDNSFSPRPTSIGRDQSTSSPRNYTPSAYSSPRNNTSSPSNPSYSTPRSYTPSSTSTPSSPSYSTPRSYSTPSRSYSPSSYGGGSYGGGGGYSGGGRSGGGGGGRR